MDGDGLWRILPKPAFGSGEIDVIFPTPLSAPRVTSVATLGPNRIVFAAGKELKTCDVAGTTCAATTITTAEDDITAVAASSVVFYGTSSGKIYRVASF